jgi:hypothetical protein
MRGTRKKPRAEILTASADATQDPAASSSPGHDMHEVPLEENTTGQSTHESSDATIEDLDQAEDEHDPQKEQEVWNSLREEYFEGTANE